VWGLSLVHAKPYTNAKWVAQTPAVQQQLQQIVGWLLPQLPDVEPEWLMYLVDGLGRLKCVLPVESVNELNSAAAGMGERLTPAQRKSLARVFAVLRQLSTRQQQLQQPTQQQQQQQRGGKVHWGAGRSTASG
jgi:hypothetical protein